MAANQRTFVVLSAGATTYKFPVKDLPPGELVAPSMPRFALGDSITRFRDGRYVTEWYDFSGPLGDEFADPGHPTLGYRGGGLNGQPGYLILPAQAPTRLTHLGTMEPVIPPTSAALSYRDSLLSPDRRIVVGLGNTLYRSNPADLSFWTNEGAITGATQITSLGIQQRVSGGAPGLGRLWAAGATSASSLPLSYSDDGGDTWLASTLEGETFVVVSHRFMSRRAPRGPGTDNSMLIVAKQDGSMYRTTGSDDTPNPLDVPVPGRVKFLASDHFLTGDPIAGGVWMLKGNTVLQLNFDEVSIRTGDRWRVHSSGWVDALYVPLIAGKRSRPFWTPFVIATDGWNVVAMASDGGWAEWLGFPPTITSYGNRVTGLYRVGEVIMAVLYDGTDSTIMGFPLITTGEMGMFRQASNLAEFIAALQNLKEARTPPHSFWTPVLSVPGRRVYWIGGYSLFDYSQAIGAVATRGILLSYDATNSYVQEFYTYEGGIMPPGGEFASSGTRVFPKFAPMPEVEKCFFGLTVGYHFPENGGSIAFAYETDSEAGTFTTSIGTITPTEANESKTVKLTLATPVPFHNLSLRVTITRGSTATKSPRVWLLGIEWYGQGPARLRLPFVIDSVEYLEGGGTPVAYDAVMSALKTLADNVTPLSMSISGYSTTYRVRIADLRPNPDEVARPGTPKDVVVVVEEV